VQALGHADPSRLIGEGPQRLRQKIRWWTRPQAATAAPPRVMEMMRRYA